MTKGLESVFGLPSMDDILGETDDVAEDEMIVPEPQVPVVTTNDPAGKLISAALDQIGDHSRAMDAIYGDTLKHAIDTAELAFDLDPARAPRMLEVSAIHYKTAMEAKNSKVEATMKMMKLLNETKKLSMDERKLQHEMGTAASDKADVVMVEDRNTLLKRLREEAAAGKKDS